jgi:hypothetical protein
MTSKETFFTREYIPLLKKLKGDEKGNWGVLSAQGMIEHMTNSIAEGWGRIKQPMQTPEAFLEKARSFALGEKEFKPGTKNSLMSETPAPLRKANIGEALAELEDEIKNFVDHHHKNPGAIIQNPFFGNFNYDEWIHLLHKHAVHHLKQFNLI